MTQGCQNWRRQKIGSPNSVQINQLSDWTQRHTCVDEYKIAHGREWKMKLEWEPCRLEARQFEFKRVDHALKYIPQSQVSRSPDHTQKVRGGVQYRSIHEGSENATHSLGQRISMGDHKPAKVLEGPDRHWRPLRNTLRWKANHSKSSGELDISERSRRFLYLVKMWLGTTGKSAVAMQGCPTLYQSLTAPQCPQIKPNRTQNGHKLPSVPGYFGNAKVICACMRA